mgnify:CR=1 FL=1
MNFRTAGTQRLSLTSDGQLNLGSRTAIAAANSTTTPTHFRISRSDNSSAPLITMGAHETAQSSSAPGAVISANHRDFIITKFHPDFSGNSPGFWLKGNEILMYSGSSETLRLDANGRLLYGNHLNNRGAELQYEGSEHACIGIHRNTNSHGSPAIILSSSRGTSAGSNTIVNHNDYLGMFTFRGTDGSDLATGAYITAIVDATPGSNDMPTRLGFWTSPDGSQTPQESMRITKDGYITKPRQAMFEATGNNVAFAAQSPLPYPNISYNIGGCYSASTYKFTAPLDGYYQVMAHVIPTDYTAGAVSYTHLTLPTKA